MPNWCANGITLRHADPQMIERVLTGRAGLLMEFLPTPQELLDTVAGSMPHGPERDAHQAQMALNFEKYGAKDWYDWNTANWGTKWDFNLENVDRVDANTVTASFDTAWAPPTGAYEKLMDLGFEIEAFYYEPGMQFVGKWADGVDDYIEYGGATADTVRDTICEELDDYFGIS